MSAIYFHSRDGETGVRGAERAHFGVFCRDLTWTVLRHIASDYSSRPAPLRKAFPYDHYVLLGSDFERDAKSFMSASLGDGLLLNGSEVDPFAMSLNTALVLGSDPVRLGARLHGQCEIHTYVEGQNRRWLADIIKQGRVSKFYRDNMGWEGVIELLESRDDSAVVTSYSVTESFPNQYVADYAPRIDDLDYDAWYDETIDFQWKCAMQGIRSDAAGLELSPDNWDGFYFRDGMDANQFVSELI